MFYVVSEIYMFCSMLSTNAIPMSPTFTHVDACNCDSFILHCRIIFRYILYSYIYTFSMCMAGLLCYKPRWAEDPDLGLPLFLEIKTLAPVGLTLGYTLNSPGELKHGLIPKVLCQYETYWSWFLCTLWLYRRMSPLAGSTHRCI